MSVRYRFKPRFIPTLAAAAGIALTLALADWQLGRAHEKEAVRARLQVLARDPPIALGAAEAKAADVEWRRVTARGVFDARHAVLLDNRVHRGVAGYHVVMPLDVGTMGGGGSRYVLVNRGWIAGTGERSRLPQVKTPEGAVEVTGLAVVPGRRFFELTGEVVEGSVWQNLTIERYRLRTGLALQPIMIQQESALEDGLTRLWDAPDLGIDKHYGYAFQWGALAATILVIYLVTNVRRSATKPA